MNQPKRIGDLNGPWALLFRVVLMLVPLSIPLFVWLVSGVWASNDHIRHTDEVTAQIEKLMECHKQDMLAVRTELREIDQRIDELPSAVWRERILALEADMKQNTADHTQIKISLEQIKAKMGIPSTGDSQ